jgi:hypothetical protein
MVRPIALLLTLLLFAGMARAEQRVALVIGNGAYRTLPPLPNPAADATAVAERLRGLGFAVMARNDLDKAGMDDAIRQFGRQAANADVAVVFYAGHGVQVEGRNYLVPVSAPFPEREQDLHYDFVDVAAIMDELAGARRLRIIMLDACRDNPIAARLSRSLGRSLGGERGLAPPPSLDNTLVAYATAADSVAADGTGEHSPFTTALLQHLDDPGLDVRLMFGRVRDDVRRQTDNKQNPFVYASLGGDSFAFNPGQAPQSQPQQPVPLAQSPVVAAPPPPQQQAVLEAVPRASVPREDWSALLAGRWRMSDGRPCGPFGTASREGGVIRFEWRLPNGRLNTAIERIESVNGNVVVTTVISDVGTPNPEVGSRVRYVFGPDQWTSFNLDTGQRAVHNRC